jgi:predicted nuclease with TOPRIM domain
MALTDLSSAQLERLVELIKEKETLQSRLDEVIQSLEALEKGDASSQTKALPRARGRRRRVRLKEALLKSLEAAGKAGITVKELAVTLGAKPSSVSVWFYTTGKKIKGIKKVGKARFAYVPSSR